MNTVAQFATGVESTFGTAVVVDRFHEILEGENLERKQTVLQPAGIRPNLWYPLGVNRIIGREWGEGSVAMEVTASGFGRWFHHMLGDGTAAADGTAGAYIHTYTPGSLVGKSLTIEKAVMDSAGSAHPFTFEGCKIPEWELQVSNDGFCILTVGINAERVTEGTAVTTANYGTAAPFNFSQAALTKDGTAIAGVTDFSVKGVNPLAVDRWYLGSSTVHAEPLEQGFREISGKLTADFIDMATFYNAFKADTSLSLVCTFTGPDIVTGKPAKLIVTLADVRFTGETPKIASAGYSVLDVPFEAYEKAPGGTAIIIQYNTGDNAI